MQLTLDLSKLSKSRVIAVIQAFYGAEDPPLTIRSGEDKPIDPVLLQMESVVNMANAVHAEPDAAAIFGAVAPFVPATVDAAALPTAPVVQPASSLPMPPAPQAPVVMPAATTSAAAPTPPAVTVDKDGLPWDARIHSSSKAINADGRWRAKKGLDDGAMVAAVQAELRSLMAIPVPPVVAAPAINTVAPTTLFEFMPLVSAAMTAGKMTVDQVNAELVALGVASGVTALISRPDLIPSLWATLQAKYAL